MNTPRSLYHMIRADFLERTRRSSFLVMLGLVVWLGYASATGMIMSIPASNVDEINSAWAGALMAVTAGMLLGWFGFYLVKGSVSRDYETGVGQIIATTPLSRPLYALGKWLSNLAVLGVMVLILMGAGLAMNLLAGQAPLDGWALVSPLLFITLPCMAIIAALAVLFETVSWLRGGFGNIVYSFLFMMLIIPAIAIPTYLPLLDLTGIGLVAESIHRAEPLISGTGKQGFNFGTISNLAAPQRFHFDGIDWTANVLLVRLFLVLVAFGLAMLASALFDRFNSSRVLRTSKREEPSTPQAALSNAGPLPPVRLTPLPAARDFRFYELYLAEMKMLLKGHRWWWYVVSLGLVIAQLVVPDGNTASLLALTWFWMVLVLSGLGNREAQYNTGEIVFSAPRPILNQLPASWLAAVTVIAFIGSGALLHYVLAGETARLMAWFGGVLFIPSLALATGVTTSSRKPFEAVYIAWLYFILNGVPPLDFVGVAPASPWSVYTLLALGLFALAAFVRQWRLAGGSTSGSFIPYKWFRR